MSETRQRTRVETDSFGPIEVPADRPASFTDKCVVGIRPDRPASVNSCSAR